jgi:hypothetical protein
MSQDANRYEPSHTGAWRGQPLDLHFDDLTWVSNLEQVIRVEAYNLQNMPPGDQTDFSDAVLKHLTRMDRPLVSVVKAFSTGFPSEAPIGALAEHAPR